jgi:malto-oligosyltrehalose synthase
VEDTAFYRYGRLLSRNDVGFDVTRFADSAEDFHANMRRRRDAFPHAMLATATHDHKRGEDVRARLAVLSEHADEWANLVTRWIVQCRPLRQEQAGALIPRAADVAMLLQIVVGAWPPGLAPRDDAGRTAFAGRLAQWQEKALREAKLATDWALPNEAYEAAARQLVTSLVADNAIPELLSEVVAFVEQIAAAGAVNGLAQTLLKLTAPGVPDIYQGTEFWDFTLVDPDNRRPVDFARRTSGLEVGSDEDLAGAWRDGRIKQALIHSVLTLRRNKPDVFAEGSYEPLAVTGKFADRVIAFARRRGSDAIVTVVPRVASMLLVRGEIAFQSGAWDDTMVMLQSNRVKNIFDGQVFDHADVSISRLFAQLPFALLVYSTSNED